MVILEDVLGRLLDLNLMLVIAGSAVYGLVLGAIPGLTALMASALLVPIIIFMDPIPAVAAIITASAMAIFAGDIPGALMRMPGTPASAAYTDDAYGLTRSGHAALALGAGLFASATGGLASAAVLALAAPLLADIALSFSSVEYFWLAALGLSCATFVAGPSLLRGLASLLLGLAFATVGMDPVSGTPRFTFGSTNLLGGLGLIPVLIGMFAVSELLRGALADPQAEKAPARIGPIVRGIGPAMWRHRTGLLRGSGIGTLVGALPGAGSDIAAWISYAVARRASRLGRRDDQDGAVERIMSASAANNASLGGAYIPATVFGIPGDAITAIVISVMFLKGINPGPTLFLNDPGAIYTIFAIFFIANILMIPLGILCIRAFGAILRLPAAYVSPMILMFCILGAFSVDNTLFAVGIIGVIGVLGYVMEANRIPIAPAILGLILGPLIEQTFMTTMLKSHGDLMIFFERPIGGTLGVITILAWVAAVALHLLPARRPAGEPALR
ncbi:tripartite tricarboxylate transporter permease [Azospirillum sp. RWY-5-1]|uniref:Tripartite tricarboxylate transporter permease n=1 Tax=Azospirillum oleiclasticum TaxID=2735135 RepID=A0ABX2T9D2_9PROT|nr:tripartite tricarboxylate transporter permease [Azospirillum oleiclasticum]NYZ13955.1 tripartite tricarboxylate transporter permease [Azospirillum oleiclasticum]NYZ20878.1 tripartite tricarboxylate transporter permease [Azospirillum oleiclasticum]